MRLLPSTLVVVLALVIGSARSAGATPITAGFISSMNICDGSCFSNQSRDVVPTSISGSAPLSAIGSASASALSGYDLHAFATATSAASGSLLATASANYLEVLTIDDPILHGTIGSYAETLHVDGSLASGGPITALAVVCVSSRTMADNQLGTVTTYQNVLTSVAGTGVDITNSFPFTYGTPFVIQLQLTAEAMPLVGLPPSGQLSGGCSQSIAQSTINHPVVGTGTANFLNTMLVTGLSVKDAAGNDVTSLVSIAAGSGATYTPNGIVGAIAAVPEPATVMLLATGLGLTLRRLRRPCLHG